MVNILIQKVFQLKNKKRKNLRNSVFIFFFFFINGSVALLSCIEHIFLLSIIVQVSRDMQDFTLQWKMIQQEVKMWLEQQQQKSPETT